MKEVIELKKSKYSNTVINPELNKYQDVVMFPEKLQEAKETIAKYGLPEAWRNKPLETKEQSAFWMNGILKQADANANIFLVIVMDNDNQINYKIHTVPEMLNKLVKSFWNEPIKVHIRPQINDENVFEYELIEVKVD